MKTKLIVIVSMVMMAVVCGCAKKPTKTEPANAKVLETMKRVNEGLEKQIVMLKKAPLADPNSDHNGPWIVDQRKTD